ncbi:MAG: low molecular weight phosphotyrosine protein phosphatase [Lachnospiraceae bacterium]|nr:low molecular weight phosphotyrosine protein phosphatase [Lachnospiraceae bacterium]
MIKVLFVCHGNICRSPMAEFVLKDMVKKQGIAQQFEIASAATSTDEIWDGIGNPVYPPAREVLAKHGISCDGKRAALLKESDYDAYDYLIGMDSMNIQSMERMTGHKAGRKIRKMLEFAGENRDCRDPWYTGQFDETYRDVVAGCTAFLEFLKREGQIA